MSAGRSMIRITAVAVAIMTVSAWTIDQASAKDEKKIKIEFTVGDQIDVKNAENGKAGEFNQCDASDVKKGDCTGVGMPKDKMTNKQALGTPTAVEVLLIVSDAASPGRTCVCYKNNCYCNY
jgi:hypothetical protein